MRVYLAGPLFTEAEQDWLRRFKAELEAAGFNVVWPYELIDQKALVAKGADAPRYIMETDVSALKECDIVTALLDGTQVDDGTAWELGCAYALNIPVLGIRTDFRNGGDTLASRVNAMIEGSCLAIVSSRQEAISRLADLAAKRGL